MNFRTIVWLFFFLSNINSASAQANWYQENLNWSDGSLNLEIDKTLNKTRILYIAAHPDDENTRLISWLVNDLQANVAYLSMTRGSGGQNLIGEELGPDLGLIREQELFAARRVDGGLQYFTSALDFGYSKSHTETFEKWGYDKILEQVVFKIREFKPNIIITRFSPETNGFRSTHGHHTASAILALEAFKLAKDSSAFPQQLSDVNIWNTRAIYWNTGQWSFGGQEKLDSVIQAEPDKYLSLDVEAYVPALGLTCSQIAAASRSMHKSQGFGTMPAYGSQLEYLQLLDGDHNASALFNKAHRHLSSYYYEGLEMAKKHSGDKSAYLLKGIEQAKRDKKLSKEQETDLRYLWLKSTGIKLFVRSEESLIPLGENELKIELVHFADTTLHLESIIIEEKNYYPLNMFIQKGDFHSIPIIHDFKDAYTSPEVIVRISGVEIRFPIIHRRSDPVIGEVIEPVMVCHPVLMEFSKNELIKVNREKIEIKGNIRILSDLNVPSKLLCYLNGEVEPSLVWEFDSLIAGNNIPVSFETAAEKLQLRFVYGDKVADKCISTIQYDHIPKIYKVYKAEITVSAIDAKCTAKKVGYVMGAGDKVPEAIQLLGAELVMIDPVQVSAEELALLDAVVFGIRALNTHEGIEAHLSKFHSYANEGGNLIFQYNTAHRLVTKDFLPKELHLELSRDRVTEEDAPVGIGLHSQHQVLVSPNLIRAQDWDHWVQERGLYFPDKWSDDFSAPLLMNDSGEPVKQGALLIAEYGEGHIVYTGLSFFRELPAGVEGAYRLWANILSL